MKQLAILSLAVVLAGPAFAQSAAEKTGVNSLIGVAPKTEDFVQEAATSDMFEIASSKLALERGDEATKAFAQQMVTDHQKTTDELKGLVTSGKVKAPLPAAMTSSQQSMLDKLNGLQGSADSTSNTTLIRSLCMKMRSICSNGMATKATMPI
jgi:putative membrane protein